MAKQLRVAKIDGSFSLTSGEVKNWLTQGFKDTDPVILKCNGRNYRLVGIKNVKSKPVMIGKRRGGDR
jgi:hypothetical protein